MRAVVCVLSVSCLSVVCRAVAGRTLRAPAAGHHHAAPASPRLAATPAILCCPRAGPGAELHHRSHSQRQCSSQQACAGPRKTGQRGRGRCACWYLNAPQRVPVVSQSWPAATSMSA